MFKSPYLFVRLDAGITDGTSLNNYTYQWTKDNEFNY
jgi:hypothetical protein